MNPAKKQQAARKPLVMVVDDDDDIRDALSEVLSRMHYDVVVASHGLDALVQLHANVRPNVIVLDLMMPVMDGYQFVAEMRKHPAFGTIPVLVITAAGNARVEAAKMRVAGHIQKPFKLDELLATIGRVIET
jgi:two-component system chemotaxis response regulator CheY